MSRSRSIVLVVLALVVGIAGILAGRAMRGRMDEPRLDAPAPPTHGLELGARFPTVSLVGEDGTARVTDDLWRDRGAVFLFLDPECAPCRTMVERWQAYANSDSLAGLPVVGITYAAPPESLHAYRASHTLTFPVLADTAAAFLRDHGVTNVPLCAIVSRSGTLERTTFDPEEAVRADELLASLAR